MYFPDLKGFTKN